MQCHVSHNIGTPNFLSDPGVPGITPLDHLHFRGKRKICKFWASFFLCLKLASFDEAVDKGFFLFPLWKSFGKAVYKIR